MFAPMDSFLFPEHELADLDSLWHGRALMLSCMGLMLLGPVALAISAWVGLWGLFGVLFMGWLLCTTPLLVLRRSGSVVLAGSMLTVIMIGTSCLGAVVGDGFEGLYTGPNNIIPFFSIVVIGRWEAGFIASVIIAAETALLYIFMRPSPCSDIAARNQVLVLVLYMAYPFVVSLFGLFLHNIRSDMLERVTKNATVKERRVVNLAHDLRTPLNGAIGICDMLQRTPMTDAQLDLLASMEATHAGLLDVINDIVIVSALEAGVVLSQQEAVTDLYKLLNRVHDTFRYAAASKDIGFVVRVPCKEFQFVHTDGQRIHQILVNLIGNAIKFTRKGRVLIDVTGEMVVGDASQYALLRFAVCDDGIGIDPAFVERFRRIGARRFDQTAEGRQYGGSGLGLFVVQGLCASLGTQLFLESTVDRGTTMHFNLKVAVVGSGRGKSFQFDRVHLLNCGSLSNNVLGDLPFIAERRWNRTLSHSETELPAGNGRTLVMLPCSSSEALFEMLREKSVKHLRCCDSMSTCKFSVEGQTKDELCMLHCALPLSVFHVFAVLTGETLFPAKLRPGQCIHPKATPQGGLDEKEGISSSDALIDSVARRLSSTSNMGDTEDEDSLMLPPVGAFRILVVDDNLLMRKVIYAQLTQLGFTHVAVAESGQEAVDVCAKQEVDLVLLDYQMPFMSGKVVCQKLREQEEKGAKRRVIVMHSASFIEYQEVLRMGADSFVEKPFSVPKLRTLLRKLVALSHT